MRERESAEIEIVSRCQIDTQYKLSLVRKGSIRRSVPTATRVFLGAPLKRRKSSELYIGHALSRRALTILKRDWLVERYNVRWSSIESDVRHCTGYVIEMNIKADWRGK
jgi:hypothetical protein